MELLIYEATSKNQNTCHIWPFSFDKLCLISSEMSKAQDIRQLWVSLNV